ETPPLCSHVEEGDRYVMLGRDHGRRSILYRHGILPQEHDLSPLSAKASSSTACSGVSVSECREDLHASPPPSRGRDHRRWHSHNAPATWSRVSALFAGDM